MIEVTPSDFLAIVLMAVVVLAGLSVAWDRLHERRSARRVRRRTVRCRVCGAVSQRSDGARLQTCPECRSATWAGRDRRLG